MYEPEVLIDKLETLLEALERIPRRFAEINKPSDFYNTDAGIDRMDAICMILIASGEEIKNIDKKTEGKLFTQYPNVKWRGVMGVRDVLVHGYFHVHEEQLFNICKYDIPKLIETIRAIIKNIEISNK